MRHRLVTAFVFIKINFLTYFSGLTLVARRTVQRNLGLHEALWDGHDSYVLAD